MMQKQEPEITRICPVCNTEHPGNIMYCTSCGYDMTANIKVEKLLEEDPEIKALNTKYINAGIARFVCGLAVCVSVFFMYQYLENDWHDIFFDMGILYFPISLIAFICFCCMRGRTAKKIRAALNRKMSNNVG